MRLRKRKCKAATVVMADPTGDLEFVLCSEGCGWWRVALHDELYGWGDDGITSDHLESLQMKLRGDGRADLADHLYRLQGALES